MHLKKLAASGMGNRVIRHQTRHRSYPVSISAFLDMEAILATSMSWEFLDFRHLFCLSHLISKACMYHNHMPLLDISNNIKIKYEGLQSSMQSKSISMKNVSFSCSVVSRNQHRIRACWCHDDVIRYIIISCNADQSAPQLDTSRSGVYFTNVLWALQNDIAKIYSSINHIYG